MRVFYYCYGSAHSSVTAANIHLGILPADRRPSVREIMHQPLFDKAEHHELGHPHYMGADEWGNQLYVIGLAGGKTVMSRALTDFLAAFGIDPTTTLFHDALQSAGVPLRIGGLASRRLGLVSVGRPLAAWGVWLKYQMFADQVQLVRDAVRQR